MSLSSSGLHTWCIRESGSQRSPRELPGDRSPAAGTECRECGSCSHQKAARRRRREGSEGRWLSLVEGGLHLNILVGVQLSNLGSVSDTQKQIFTFHLTHTNERGGASLTR